jgi:hypothetical protein
MNYTDSSQIIHLGDLNYEQVEALLRWCNNALRQGGPLEAEQYKKQEKIWAANMRKNERQKQLEAERAPRVLRWLKTNLNVGAILHVKGAKDGRGLREFIRFDGDNLVCWKLAERQRNDVKPERTTYCTTHMPDKVIWVDTKMGRQKMSDL